MHWICHRPMPNVKQNKMKNVILLSIGSKWFTLTGFVNQSIKCEAPKVDTKHKQGSPLQVIIEVLCLSAHSVVFYLHSSTLIYSQAATPHLQVDSPTNRSPPSVDWTSKNNSDWICTSWARWCSGWCTRLFIHKYGSQQIKLCHAILLVEKNYWFTKLSCSSNNHLGWERTPPQQQQRKRRNLTAAAL